MKRLTVFVDGGIAGVGHTGAAAVARAPEGYFLGWLSRQMLSLERRASVERALHREFRMCLQSTPILTL